MLPTGSRRVRCERAARAAAERVRVATALGSRGPRATATTAAASRFERFLELNPTWPIRRAKPASRELRAAKEPRRARRSAARAKYCPCRRAASRTVFPCPRAISIVIRAMITARRSRRLTSEREPPASRSQGPLVARCSAPHQRGQDNSQPARSHLSLRRFCLLCACAGPRNATGASAEQQ